MKKDAQNSAPSRHTKLPPRSRAVGGAPGRRGGRVVAAVQAYLTESVSNVVLQKSISTQIRQPTLHVMIVRDKLSDLRRS